MNFGEQQFKENLQAYAIATVQESRKHPFKLSWCVWYDPALFECSRVWEKGIEQEWAWLLGQTRIWCNAVNSGSESNLDYKWVIVHTRKKKRGGSGKLMLGFSSQAVRRLTGLSAWLCAWWGGRCTFRWIDFSNVNGTVSAPGFTWGEWRGLVRSCLLAHPGLCYTKRSAKSEKWFTSWSCWATKTSVFLKGDFNMFSYVSVFLPSLKMQNYCLMCRPIGISQGCLLFKVIFQEVFLILFDMFVWVKLHVSLSHYFLRTEILAMDLRGRTVLWKDKTVHKQVIFRKRKNYGLWTKYETINIYTKVHEVKKFILNNISEILFFDHGCNVFCRCQTLCENCFELHVLLVICLTQITWNIFWIKKRPKRPCRFLLIIKCKDMSPWLQWLEGDHSV